MDKQTKILLAVVGIIAAVVAVARLIELNSELVQTAWRNIAVRAKTLVTPSQFPKAGPLYVLAPAETSVETLIAPKPEIIKINPEGNEPPFFCYVYMLPPTNGERLSLLTVQSLQCEPNTAATRWRVKSAAKTVTFAELEQLLKDAPVAKVDELFGKPQQKITGFCGRKFVKYIYKITELDPPSSSAFSDWRLVLDLADERVQCWGLIGAIKFDLNQLNDRYFGNVAAP